MSELREVELSTGRIIKPVTRIAESRTNPEIDNVHTPGSGHYPVYRSQIESIRPITGDYE